MFSRNLFNISNRHTTSRIMNQLSILLTKIQIYKLQLMTITLAFLLPISGILILIALFIFFDTVTGIWKSIKTKTKVTSRGLSQIISKILLYEFCVILFFLLDKLLLSEFIAQFFSIELLTTKVLALTLCSIELISINENIKVIRGVDLWTSVKMLFRRAKEITSEYKDINK